MRAKFRLVFLLVLTAVSLGAVALALVASPAEALEKLFVLGLVGYPLAGVAILAQRPGNRIGWLLMAVGLLNGVSFLFLTVASNTVIPIEWRVWVELGGELAFYPVWIAMVSIAVLFPTGRPAGRFERVLYRVLWLVAAAVILLAAVEPKVLEETGRVNPLGVQVLGGVATWVTNDSFIIVPLLTLAALASLVLRWLRAQGSEKLQFRWFMAGVAVLLISLIVLMASEGPTVLVATVVIVGLNALPVAIGIAVLKYRLYDIDRLISRTVGYTLVIAVLAGVYGLAVAGIPSVLPALEDSDLLIAAATLAAFFLFNPLRKRLLRAVDRRFYRSRYDTQQIVDDFAIRLRSELDLDELTADWLDTVDQAIKPVSASVWIRTGNGSARNPTTNP